MSITSDCGPILALVVLKVVIVVLVVLPVVHCTFASFLSIFFIAACVLYASSHMCGIVLLRLLQSPRRI